jgi:secretion/DNA translocation related TadE-like protein
MTCQTTIARAPDNADRSRGSHRSAPTVGHRRLPVRAVRRWLGPAGMRIARRGVGRLPRSRHLSPAVVRGSSERGSGTLWMIALLALVWLVAVVAMTAGGVRAARHRAHATADAAALAAAAHAAEGTAGACHVAATVARAARGRLSGCVLRGPVADIEVVMTARVPGFGPLPLAARARAGPAGEVRRGQPLVWRVGRNSALSGSLYGMSVVAVRNTSLSPIRAFRYRWLRYAVVSIRVPHESARCVGHLGLRWSATRTTKGRTP